MWNNKSWDVTEEWMTNSGYLMKAKDGGRQGHGSWREVTRSIGRDKRTLVSMVSESVSEVPRINTYMALHSMEIFTNWRWTRSAKGDLHTVFFIPL